MKAIFSNFGAPVSGQKNSALGTSTGSRGAKLDHKTLLIIRLVCHVLGNLDRQSIAATERNLPIKSDQRRLVAREIAEYSGRNEGLSKIMRGFQSSRVRRHNDAYSIYDNLCMILGRCQRFDRSTVTKLAHVGKGLGLTQDEALRVMQKSGLTG